jgi:hypothetical protein
MTVAVELPTIQLRAIRPQGWATQAGRAVVRGPVLLGAAGQTRAADGLKSGIRWPPGGQPESSWAEETLEAPGQRIRKAP